jgi:LacI family transcriptional regulator
MVPKKKYTIADIAKELNTTISTVSRALQNNPRISVKMRNAVQELAVKNNYQPDYRASSLRSGSAKTIGVLVPKVDRHFFATVLSGIDDVLADANYSVIICQSFESYEKEKQLVQNLMNGKVDGIIASISTETRDASHFELMVSKGLPLVFFDRVWEPLRVSKVLVDDYLGATMAVEHLIMNGCRKIAHFAGPQHINVYKNRTKGYINTLKKHGIEVDESLIFNDVITRDTGCKAMEKILQLNERPDAIFSSGDYSALGAILCAKNAGVAIPDEIAITGFANEPWDSFFEPTLTSVDQHAFDIGRQAATLLLEQLNNKKSTFVPRTVVLTPELIVRKSSFKRF